LGIKTGMLWTSALIPTTRSWHAAKNGKVLTTAEVKAFYSVNGNRYRCRCAQTEALLDADGKPILTKKTAIHDGKRTRHMGEVSA